MAKIENLEASNELFEKKKQQQQLNLPLLTPSLNHILHLTPNLMIWEQLFVWEKLCLWLFKISTGMQDANLRSMAGIALHAIAEMERVHSSVTIATRTLKCIPNIPLLWSYQAFKCGIWLYQSLIIAYHFTLKYNSFSCYNNAVVLSFHFSNDMQCMPCSWDFHYTCQC